MRKVLVFVVFSILLVSSASAQEETDYQELVKRIEASMNQALYAESAFNHPRTQMMLLDLKAAAETADGDEDILDVVNDYRARLPFTHFWLTPPKKDVSEGERNPSNEAQTPPENVTVEPLEDGIWKIRIRSFNSLTLEETRDAFAEVVDADASGLVIDLRGNRGGTYSAGYVAGHLLDAPATAGALFARPAREQVLSGDWSPFPAVPVQKIRNLGHLAEIVQTHGAFLFHIEPLEPHYGGPVAVLTNKNTGSANEPLVDALKTAGRVTVVGEPTAGAMLSGFNVDVGQGWGLFLPVYDYVNPEGVRLDLRGVAPHILVQAEEAESTALRHLAGAKMSEVEGR